MCFSLSFMEMWRLHRSVCQTFGARKLWIFFELPPHIFVWGKLWDVCEHSNTVQRTKKIAPKNVLTFSKRKIIFPQKPGIRGPLFFPSKFKGSLSSLVFWVKKESDPWFPTSVRKSFVRFFVSPFPSLAMTRRVGRRKFGGNLLTVRWKKWEESGQDKQDPKNIRFPRKFFPSPVEKNSFWRGGKKSERFSDA